MSNRFGIPEDKQFFADVLCDGNTEHLDSKFYQFFDFRDPEIKRQEFLVKYAQVKHSMIDKYGSQCMLQISPQCLKNTGLTIDHLIPLSSNKLNKELRHMSPLSGKKVKTQSFGSNNNVNLILACGKCNALKMNNLPDAYPVVRKLVVERAVQGI